MAIAEMTTQSIAESLLAEFEEQAPITRRFLGSACPKTS